MADAAAPAPKIKKLPFKPTALRKAAPEPTPEDGSKKSDDDDGLALFRRSKEMAPIVARDRERRMQKNKRNKEVEGQRRSSGAEKRRVEEDDEEHSKLIEAQLGDDCDRAEASFRTDRSVTVKGDSFNELVTPPPSKRTRFGYSSPGTRPITPNGLSQGSPSARLLRSLSKRSTPRRRPDSVQATPSGVPIVSLESDPEDEDVRPIFTPTKSRVDSVEIVGSEPQTQPVEPNEEEDEFAEYIRKAEEARRNLASGTSEGPGIPKAEKANLIVTSAIEGTRSCGVKFFFDKPMHQIRTAWVNVQRQRKVHLPVSPSELILTWRGSKVYNYSTLHSLGIRRYGDGVVADGNSRKGLSADGMQVHMEIWTPDMFSKWEEEEERRRKVLAGELSDEEDPEVEEQPEVTLRVILKARDLDEVGLKVRPATTVETLVTGFRAKSNSNLGADKEVTLWFDGDMMEEHVTMEEADISDMDVIEVHIK